MTTRRSTARRTLAPLAAALAGVLLLPTPAVAASWQTVNRAHGGLLQACSEPVGQKVRVTVRIDNRKASHVHVGGMSTRGQERNLRARPGQLTNAASFVVGRYVQISIGIGETNGEGSGDVLRASSFRRC